MRDFVSIGFYKGHFFGEIDLPLFKLQKGIEYEEWISLNKRKGLNQDVTGSVLLKLHMYPVELKDSKDISSIPQASEGEIKDNPSLSTEEKQKSSPDLTELVEKPTIEIKEAESASGPASSSSPPKEKLPENKEESPPASVASIPVTSATTATAAVSALLTSLALPTNNNGSSSAPASPLLSRHHKSLTALEDTGVQIHSFLL